jgi:DNA repair protein SbcD/Mre11
MRILHTGDWHLGRQMHNVSRQIEFEAILDEVVGIAKDEGVDVFIIAGDIFDTFSPPPEAERLLYEALLKLLSEKVQVVIVAGNHDHAQRMDAPADILRLANIHCIGSVPRDEAYEPLRLRSRDGAEELAIVALPWVPERWAFDFETLAHPIEESAQQYAGKLERVIRHFWSRAARDPLKMFAGHMLVQGSVVSENGGERRLHIGQAFAVQPQSLPRDANYIALGHVHRYQKLQTSAEAFYAGSLLQLDFGEEGQPKYVSIAEMKKGIPTIHNKVELSMGRRLRSVTLRLDELPKTAERFGDDFLRVTVEIEHPVLNLYQQTREFLPNAVEVIPKLPAQESLFDPTEDRGSLAPDELFRRYYLKRNDQEPREELVALFNQLHAEIESNGA